MKIEVINDPEFYIWETFRDTVEGKPSQFSAILTQDKIDIIPKAIGFGAEPQPELVAELLRSKIPLTHAARNILADLLDLEAGTAFCFRFGRRKRGRHPAWNTLHIDAVQYVYKRLGEGVPEKAAKMDAAKKFDISKRTLETSLKNVNDQRAAYAKFAARFSDAD